MYEKNTTKDGLRIITVPDESSKAVTVLVLVGTGSKYETGKNNGISHFLEHMLFKGTKKRPNALKIAETLDQVGGMYNAFTSKEVTGYYAKVDASHSYLALDWVSDIFLHSKLETKDIKKERGVILEEFNMILDHPMSYVDDLFEKLLYGDQPAGWEIIGKKDNILRFQRKDFLNYFKDHYSALNTIVCVSGNFNQKLMKAEIEKKFKSIQKHTPQQKIRTTELQKEPRVLVFPKKTDQTHLCLGARSYDLFHPKIDAEEVLSVILGGNMSSRLFTEIREKRGLAYYVRTSSEKYTDSGYLVTKAGIPNNAVEKVVDLILKEYRSIREKGVHQKELKKAKDYLKGSLILSLESSDRKASFYATQEILMGKILTVQEKCAKIDKVKVSDIGEVAREIFQKDHLNLALIGPHKDKFRLNL